jgi:hypothetical protein
MHMQFCSTSTSRSCTLYKAAPTFLYQTPDLLLENMFMVAVED